MLLTVEPGHESLDFPFSCGSAEASGPGLFSLVLVKAGSVRLGTGAPVVSHPAGSLLLVPPTTARPVRTDAATQLAMVHFARSVIDGIQAGDAAGLVVELLASTEPVAVRFTNRQLAGLATGFQEMGDELENRGLAWQAMIGLKLLELLILLARGCYQAVTATGDNRPADTTSLVRRFHPDEARSFIQTHCSDALTLTDLASRYGMNPSYFSRLFHAKTGMAVVECINQARIQKSCLLLKRTQAGILEIATSVGYNNLSHFNKYFRRIVGMSPRDWRNLSQK